MKHEKVGETFGGCGENGISDNRLLELWIN